VLSSSAVHAPSSLACSATRWAAPRTRSRMSHLSRPADPDGACTANQIARLRYRSFLHCRSRRPSVPACRSPSKF
jgi:hypothetical protein